LVAAGGLARISLSGTGSEAAPMALTVVIDGYDTGVENRLNDDKPISEHLAMCEEAKNHGQYVRCVGLKIRQMRRKKILNEDESRAIMKAAAHANIPPRESGLEDLVYNGTPVTDLIKECKENAENNREYMRCVRQLMKEMKKEGVIKSRKEKHKMRRYAARLIFHGWH
jgi:hypothetical protein